MVNILLDSCLASHRHLDQGHQFLQVTQCRLPIIWLRLHYIFNNNKMGANKRNAKKYHSKTNKYNLTKPARKPIQSTTYSPSEGKYASDIAQLRPAHREDGFHIKEIVPDGNCLFRAFSFFRESGNQENHMKYRKEVINYLR